LEGAVSGVNGVGVVEGQGAEAGQHRSGGACARARGRGGGGGGRGGGECVHIFVLSGGVCVQRH
jgi:hypothetical protein